MSSAARTRRPALTVTEQAVYTAIATADYDPTWRDLRRLTGVRGAALREALLGLVERRQVHPVSQLGATAYRIGAG